MSKCYRLSSITTRRCGKNWSGRLWFSSPESLSNNNATPNVATLPKSSLTIDLRVVPKLFVFGVWLSSPCRIDKELHPTQPLVTNSMKNKCRRAQDGNVIK
ncbi:unnamed protein product [Macrosiphum euphorbiae]|uniref:Uncharacterized protein n=1 Tax=Macrosiphum euphorbiae TaxID=13131 RepID=A0AAV0XWN3_9HEMI|nr:unnamed protein product [Macrosiphum euphorbiae]